MSVSVGTPVTEFRRRALVRAIAGEPAPAGASVGPLADDPAVRDVFASHADLLRAVHAYRTVIPAQREG